MGKPKMIGFIKPIPQMKPGIKVSKFGGYYGKKKEKANG